MGVDRSHMGAEPAERRRWSLQLTAELVETLVVGKRPVEPRQGPRPPRAVRAAGRKVRIDSHQLTWRSRLGTVGSLPIADIARVALIEAEYLTARVPTPVALYAMVIDHDDAVRVRIAAEGNRSTLGAAGKRQLTEMWGPLGVPVTRETTTLGKVKDYRRRWPEAFSFAHAHPLATAVLVFAAWMLLVVPVLDRALVA